MQEFEVDTKQGNQEALEMHFVVISSQQKIFAQVTAFFGFVWWMLKTFSSVSKQNKSRCIYLNPEVIILKITLFLEPFPPTSETLSKNESTRWVFDNPEYDTLW